MFKKHSCVIENRTGKQLFLRIIDDPNRQLLKKANPAIGVTLSGANVSLDLEWDPAKQVTQTTSVFDGQDEPVDLYKSSTRYLAAGFKIEPNDTNNFHVRCDMKELLRGMIYTFEARDTQVSIMVGAIKKWL